MNRFEIFFSILRIPFDYAAIVLAALLAYFIRPVTDLVPFMDIPFSAVQLMPFEVFMPLSLLFSGGFVILVSLNGGYSFVNTQGRFWEFFKILLSAIYLVVAIVAFYALFKVETFFSRGVLIMMGVFGVMFSFFFRMMLRQLERILLKKGMGVRKIAIFGADKMRKHVVDEVRHSLHYEVAHHARVFNEKKVNPDKINEVWFIKTEKDDAGRELLEFAQVNQLLYRFVPDVFGTLHAKMEEGTIGPYPLLAVHPTPLEGWGRVAKRLMDLLLSSIGIIILTPFFLVLALLIKFGSKGPVFYVSERVGKNGKLFNMFKFRSMIVNADELKAKLEKQNHRKDSPLFKVKNDPRITPFGRFLRRYSIDELPQLFNVFIGNMSLVGPRAHLPNEVEKYSLDQRRVLTIKPGISGLPQISGRSDLDFDEEIRLDLHYIVHWSVLLDLKIIWKTPFVLLQGNGAD